MSERVRRLPILAMQKVVSSSPIIRSYESAALRRGVKGSSSNASSSGKQERPVERGRSLIWWPGDRPKEDCGLASFPGEGCDTHPGANPLYKT